MQPVRAFALCALSSTESLSVYAHIPDCCALEYRPLLRLLLHANSFDIRVLPTKSLLTNSRKTTRQLRAGVLAGETCTSTLIGKTYPCPAVKLNVHTPESGLSVLGKLRLMAGQNIAKLGLLTASVTTYILVTLTCHPPHQNLDVASPDLE